VSIFMASLAQGYNIQPMIGIIPVMVMIFACLNFLTIGADKITSRLEFAVTNSIVHSIARPISIRMKQMSFPNKFKNFIRIFSLPIFIGFALFFKIIKSPLTCYRVGFFRIFVSGYFYSSLVTFFTVISQTIFAVTFFIKLTTIFSLIAARAKLFHDVLQKKMPAASRSSSKQQAGKILTHNALARPIAFDCFKYNI
jgi:hypothetical protein